MTVEHRDGSNGSRYTVTTECPYCGAEIPSQSSIGFHVARHCEEVPR